MKVIDDPMAPHVPKQQQIVVDTNHRDFERRVNELCTAGWRVVGLRDRRDESRPQYLMGMFGPAPFPLSIRDCRDPEIYGHYTFMACLERPVPVPQQPAKSPEYVRTALHDMSELYKKVLARRTELSQKRAKFSTQHIDAAILPRHTTLRKKLKKAGINTGATLAQHKIRNNPQWTAPQSIQLLELLAEHNIREQGEPGGDILGNLGDIRRMMREAPKQPEYYLCVDVQLANKGKPIKVVPVEQHQDGVSRWYTTIDVSHFWISELEWLAGKCVSSL